MRVRRGRCRCAKTPRQRYGWRRRHWTGLAGGMTVASCDMGCLRIDTHVHVSNRRQLSLVDITLHTDPPCLPFLRSLWTGLGRLASGKQKGSLQGLGCFYIPLLVCDAHMSLHAESATVRQSRRTNLACLPSVRSYRRHPGCSVAGWYTVVH